MIYKFKYILINIALVIITCSILTGCTNPYLSKNEESLPTLNIDTEEDIDNNLYKAEGHIKLGLYNLDTMNPLTTNNKSFRAYLSLIFDSLIVYDKDCSPRYCIADDINTIDGGLSWKIILKENVLFHDESRLTAYDVKNTIEWIQKNKCYYSEILDNIKTIDITKNNELTVILKEHDSIFPSKLNFPIIKSEDLSGDYTKLNGTGMYKQTSGMTFSVFENYYDALPKIKSIEILNFDSSEELFASDADIIMWQEDDSIKYSNKNNYSVAVYDDDILSCLIPSAKVSNELKNYLCSILNKELIVKAVYANKASIKSTPIPDKTYFLNNYSSKISYDSNDIILTNPIKFIVKETDYDLLRIAEIIEKELPKTILTETLICTEKEYNDLLKSGEYDFALYSMKLAPYPDFYDVFYSGGAKNLNKFNDTSVDNLILSIKDAFKNSETSLVNDYNSFCEFSKTQVGKLSILLEEKLPVIPISQRKASVFVSNRITGISLYNFNFWNTFDSFTSVKINEN